MKNRTNVAPWIIFVALCAGAFFAPWLLPWAEAQRTGYVEKTASGAFANQLAPNPAAGLVLTPVGTDTSKVQWGTSGSGLPPGEVDQVAAIAPTTAIVTVVATNSFTGTQTATRTQTANGTGTETGTHTETTTFTETATMTGTYTRTETVTMTDTNGVAIGTYTYTYTGTGTPTGVRTATGTQIVTATRTLTGTGTATGTQTLTGTVTITGTQTNTNTVSITNTQTETITETQTNTYPVSSTATAVGTGTGTEWKAEGANRYDPAGTFFLTSLSGEGSEAPLWLRWGELAEGGTPHSYSATCSTGSDGLIATIEPAVPQLVTRLRAPAGWWKAHLRARVNANGAAVRVEVWTHDPPSADMKLFDWTTDAFTNVAPSVITKEYHRTPEDTTPSGAALKIFFKLYATCSTETIVTLDLGDDDFDSRIQSPLLGDRILASEVQQVGYPGYTVQDVLTDFTSSRRPLRKVMIPASQFAYITVAPRMTLGTDPNILSVIRLYDGETDYAAAAVVTIPTDLAATSISVVPVWAPVVTDTWSFARIRWSLVHKVLQHFPTPVDATAAGTTTTWSGYYCSSNCTANYIQESDGYTINDINAGDTVMFSLGRLGADAADTFTGDINLIGMRIEYTSSL